MSGKIPSDGSKTNQSSASDRAEKKAELEMLSQSTFENVQKKSVLRLRHKTAFYIVLLSVFCIFVGAVIFTVFFRVKHISVSGLTVYDDWRIIEASGITVGQNSYSFSKSDVENAITKEFPYVKSVKIRHTSPSSVDLNITEDNAEYYFTLDDEYFILSSTLKVLEIIKDSDLMSVRPPDLIQIYISGVSVAIVGKTIEFSSERYYDYVVDTLETFSQCSMAPFINIINCRNKFSVYFIFDDRYKIEIGNTDDLTMKLTFASAIIENLSKSESGIINVENQTAFFISQAITD